MTVRNSKEWSFDPNVGTTFYTEAAITQTVIYYHYNKKIYGYHLVKGIQKELCDLADMEYQEVKLCCVPEDNSVYVYLIGASVRFYRLARVNPSGEWELQSMDIRSLSKENRAYMVDRNIINDLNCKFDDTGFTYKGKMYAFETPLKCSSFQWIRKIGKEYYIVLTDANTGHRELWHTSTNKGKLFQKTSRSLCFLRKLAPNDSVVYCPLTSTFYTIVVTDKVYSIHEYPWTAADLKTK